MLISNGLDGYPQNAVERFFFNLKHAPAAAE